jgi:hypothetical protein
MSSTTDSDSEQGAGDAYFPERTYDSSSDELGVAGDSDTDNSDDVQEIEGTFFEGVEKLLEVWFTKSDGKTQDCDLRRIPK